MQIDDTIRGFWRELELDTSVLDVWRIYCDYLEEAEHLQAETTRLWVEDRYSEISPESQCQLRENLKQGLRPLLPRRTNSIGTELVLVPRGTFWMSENWQNAQKLVTIEHDFYIGVHPITQGEWVSVMDHNPSLFSRTGGAREVENISDEELLRFPIENVSWNDVQTFLDELNKQESQSVLSYGFPTEAEWEYTCRGGLTSIQECNYHFYLSEPTNDLSSHQANFYGNYPAGSAPQGEYLKRPSVVGSYESNALGIHDMHGNVWERCEDLISDSYRVYRGGGWSNSGESCRASYRRWSHPDARYHYVGFRLAAVLSRPGTGQ